MVCVNNFLERKKAITSYYFSLVELTPENNLYFLIDSGYKIFL